MTQPPVILVVDDDTSHRLMLRAVLEEAGYAVREAARAEAALEQLRDRAPDLVLMDLKMPGMGGLEGLKAVGSLRPGLPVIIMTAYASVGTAVEALKSGAVDYLTKPLDIEEVKLTLAKVLEHRRLAEENRALRERLSASLRFPSLVGESPGMQKVFETIAMVAPTDATVLISGESGTGKELVAEAIHRSSPRAEHPLVRVNCAALPETLLESELFGHEKGAFTGAVARRVGRFGAADGGSIFLDEVAEMSPAIQAKFLRVLESSSFEPVGSSKTVSVDIRVVAATNRPLKKAVEEGRFREDLYYRLNVVPIHLPPLRQRVGDIPILAEHFLRLHAGRLGREMAGFAPEAMASLQRYPWPGNVRELGNALERAVIICRDDRIGLSSLPEEIASPAPAPAAPPLPGGGTLDEMEREIIRRTLEETGGNRSEAARRLGITRQTLLRKIDGTP
jgi:two-component system response regulator HydG